MKKDITEALDWRYAVKKYDTTKKISDEDFQLLLRSLQQAPSSYGLQPFKFFVVENPEVRAKLKTVSWDQAQITDADRLVIVAFRENTDESFIQKYIDRIAEVRGIPKESLEGFKSVMVQKVANENDAKKAVWSQRQSYLAMGFLLETAALLKIDATPMEGLDPLAYDTILGLSGSGWKTIAAVALGYRHADDSFQHFKKVRFEQSSLIEYVK